MTQADQKDILDAVESTEASADYKRADQTRDIRHIIACHVNRRAVTEAQLAERAEAIERLGRFSVEEVLVRVSEIADSGLTPMGIFRERKFGS